jgi:hypothetical protein
MDQVRDPKENVYVLRTNGNAPAQHIRPLGDMRLSQGLELYLSGVPIIHSIYLTVHFRTSVTPSIRHIAQSLFITSSMTCLVFDRVVPYEWPLPKVIIHSSVLRTQRRTLSSSNCTISTAVAAELIALGDCSLG